MWAVHFKLYSGHVRWHCQTVLFYFAVSIIASSSLLVSLGFSPHLQGHSSHSWLKIRRHPSALLQARGSWPPSCFHFAEELLLYSQIGLYPSNVSYFRWAHDNIGVRLYHSSISNVSLSDKSWKQVSLPNRFGGLGFRSARALSLPCFLSSSYASTSLVRLLLSSVPDLSRLMFFRGVIVTLFQLGNRGRNNAVLRR